MSDNVKRSLARIRSVRGVAPAERWPAAKAVVRRRAGQALKRARRRTVTGQVKVVQIAMGPATANRYFWRAPTKDPTWYDVQRRMEHLHDRHPDHLAHFVVESLERASDPIAMIGLARHPYSDELVAAWLSEHAEGGSAVLARRLRDNRLLGAAVAGAARLLLEPERAQAVTDWVIDLYQLPDSRLFQFIDSVGSRPSATGSAPAATGRTIGRTAQRARHRVVISERLTDKDAVALLLPGAERATLVATSDTFGMADFSAYGAWPGVGEITVEHIRSRITRFSPEYIDIHGAVTDVARRASHQIAAIPGLLDPSDRRFVAVEIADFLFFQALKIRAIELLLSDPDVDHVVLALGNQQPSDEFLGLVAGVSGLLDDPRLEIVSTSRSATTCASFWGTVDALFAPVHPSGPLSGRVPEPLVLRKFDEEARRLAGGLGSFPASTRPWVQVVTANNAAYNESTVGYVHELLQQFDVRILHMGRNATSLTRLLVECGDADRVAIDFLAPGVGTLTPLADLLMKRLVDSEPFLAEPTRPAEHAAAWAFRSTVLRLTRNSIAPSLARMRAMRHWYERLETDGELPDVAVLTPNRVVGVGAVTSVARRHHVPSIVLEPHMQDANYSRYVKIAADYYGVMSDYFRTHAATGFGIESERTFSVGSPRQIAPPGYDPEVATRAARTAYHDEHGVAFAPDVTQLVYFGQPSDWGHVSKVWSIVLEAAKQQGCRILLKTHPEESVSRTARYLERAAALGASDRIVLLNCDAPTAIALGDIAIAMYSTAGIDAAIRQKPVICVADGETPYPVDIPAIVGAPRARSVEELTALLEGFRADPEELKRRARSLIEVEPQFVEGPGPRVRSLVTHAIERGAAGLRAASEVPDSLFLDGPHPTFPV